MTICNKNHRYPFVPLHGLYRRMRLTALSALLLAAWLPAPYSVAADGPDRFCVLPSDAVTPDRYFNDLFTRSNGGWTGGDGTYSVPLPDGRTLWMFGDTFVGRVNPDRTRPRHSPLIRNSFVIQRRNELKTLHRGTNPSPRALVAPLKGKGFYWPGDGMVVKDRLSVFFNRFVRTGSQPWQWRWLETAVFDFTLPGLVQVSKRQVVAGAGIMYGAAIYEEGRHVYVYGTEDLGQMKYAHVARFFSGDVDGRWQYFTDRGWHPAADRSVRILSGVANQFSVIHSDGRYLLITTDSRRPFVSTIVGYVSSSPYGDWSPAVRIYDPPEAADGVVAYNALAHPQFTQDNRLLLSYNLSHPSDLEAPYRNADVYRPRFVRVDLEALIRCLPAQQRQP